MSSGSEKAPAFLDLVYSFLFAWDGVFVSNHVTTLLPVNRFNFFGNGVAVIMSSAMLLNLSPIVSITNQWQDQVF